MSMLWNSLMKKPMLVIGIIMMVLFIYSLRSGKSGQGFFYNRDVFKSWSCKPVVLMLEKSAPKTWSYTCTESLLKIAVEMDEKLSQTQERQLLYREMANGLIYVSKVSPEENLERIPVVQFYLVGTHLRVDGVVSGEELIKFKNISNAELLRQHFKASVQVKEIAL